MLAGYLGDGPALNLGAGTTGAEWRGDRRPISVDVTVRRSVTRPFAQADAQALPFRSRTFAGALAKDVLEHVDDVERAVRELSRVIRPGGRLVVTVPRAVPRAVWADPTHRRGFTKLAVQLLLQQAGFEVEFVRRIGAIPGAGRLGIERHLVTILRLPGFGHRFGTNWLVVATLAEP